MSNSIDEAELARLEALAGKASKGPFFVIEADDAMSMSSIYVSTESKEYELGEKPESVFAVTLAQSGGRVACHHDFLWLENAHYIAAACNAVPALVAEVRRLRAEAKQGGIDYCALMDRHDVQFVRAEKLKEKVEAWEDAAEFEATVAAKLTRLDAEDLPCANSMVMFCPKPPFWGRNCGPWCILRMARLDAEEEMEKHADRE